MTNDLAGLEKKVLSTAEYQGANIAILLVQVANLATTRVDSLYITEQMHHDIKCLRENGYHARTSRYSQYDNVRPANLIM